MRLFKNGGSGVLAGRLLPSIEASITGTGMEVEFLAKGLRQGVVLQELTAGSISKNCITH